jgi:hypothetical protein
MLKEISTQVSTFVGVPDYPKILGLAMYRRHAVPILIGFLAIDGESEPMKLRAVEYSLKYVSESSQAVREDVGVTLINFLLQPEAKTSSDEAAELAAIRVLKQLRWLPDREQDFWEKYEKVVTTRFKGYPATVSNVHSAIPTGKKSAKIVPKRN